MAKATAVGASLGVPVRFSVNANLSYGEELNLCGSVPVLGSWMLEGAVRMLWREDEKLWVSDVVMPTGATVEFKFVVTREDGGTRWISSDAGDNFRVAVRLEREGCAPTQLLSTHSDWNVDVSDITMGGGLANTVAHGGSIAQAPAPGDSVNSFLEGAKAAAASGNVVSVTHTTTTTVTVGGEEVAGPVDGVSNDARGGPPPSRLGLPRGSANDDAGFPDQTEEALHSAAYADALALNCGLVKVGKVRLSWPETAGEVFVMGSWDGWATKIALEPLCAVAGENQGWLWGSELIVPIGMETSTAHFELKFIVDGKWSTHPNMKSMSPDGNNYIDMEDIKALNVLPGMLQLPAAVDAVDVGEAGKNDEEEEDKKEDDPDPVTTVEAEIV